VVLPLPSGVGYVTDLLEEGFLVEYGHWGLAKAQQDQNEDNYQHNDQHSDECAGVHLLALGGHASVRALTLGHRLLAALAPDGRADALGRAARRTLLERGGCVALTLAAVSHRGLLVVVSRYWERSKYLLVSVRAVALATLSRMPRRGCEVSWSMRPLTLPGPITSASNL
jgi:hypothetical protein